MIPLKVEWESLRLHLTSRDPGGVINLRLKFNFLEFPPSHLFVVESVTLVVVVLPTITLLIECSNISLSYSSLTL
jgi:hypothetical protein